ncbi:MAG: hypothetical protein ACRYF4_02880 [Janthinobacterium lividum]
MTPVDDRATRVAEWKRLTEQVLPALAKQHRWPLRLDHCFKRVCLDFAYDDVWYDHVQKPAERHMSDEALQGSIACANEIVEQGVPLLRLRNEASLRVRALARIRTASAKKKETQESLNLGD